MSTKLTKNRLRAEKIKLTQLRSYLPTLKLKKALLQVEVQNILSIVEDLREGYKFYRNTLHASKNLLGVPIYFGDLASVKRVQHIIRHNENIAGVEVPVLDDVVFVDRDYSLLDTPIWMDSLLELVRNFLLAKIRLNFASHKKLLLEQELRSVSIRVNLFEKKLIPESEKTIRHISVFLGDRNMMEIGQIKIAKNKITEKKIESQHAN